ncbi:N-acetylmuramoyl-L-alanine amidase [Kordiimonas pumila]|uniref:N-acetylmuramoyl-L-alanine amidase n=1 Tax=Kordiimonas pumila TaxID=2161677 RepID=A0ABV7D8P7_9PROT|nr:N-acetylmuramoyl-L-alanine amidase [Kordiimonas pumila]
MITCSSPNWDERPDGSQIDLVVLHYTGMETGDAALLRLCDAEAKVSAHYMIGEEGAVYALVPEEKRAWHAGVSSWLGRDNINHTSIGIELVNPGHEFGYRPFPAVQIDSLLALLSGIKARHKVPYYGYVGHSDIAPLRKTDPGEYFPWQQLAVAGFGLHSAVDGADTALLPVKGADGVLLQELHEKLSILGYAFTDSKAVDSETFMVLKAFQAHWRQSAVTGFYDIGTRALLTDLARQMSTTGETQ